MGYLKNALENKIKKVIKNVFIEQIRNTENAAQIQALLESNEFIKTYLRDVPKYSDKWKLMDKCIKVAMKRQTDKDIYIEFGVYTGASINYIADRIHGKVIYGFDSFEGLPSFWRDGFEKGAFKVDQLPNVRKNVKLIKGWFSDTLKDFKCADRRIAMIHIDCDLYESTKCVFDMLSPYIKSGTVIVFDELYNYPGWKEGEYKALTEWAEKSGKNYKYLGFVAADEQCAIIIE